MSGLLYIYKSTIKNLIKKALRKPVTYIYITLMIFYIGVLFSGAGSLLEMFNINTNDGLVSVLSFFVFWMVPANLFTYAKRKGLIFRPSDVQFVFTAPFNPKLVLQYAQVRNYAIGLVWNLIISISGVLIFKMPVLYMVAYFILSFVIENILEGSLMTLLYGNEGLSKKTIKWISRAILMIIGVLLLFAAYLFFTVDSSWGVIALFLKHPFLQCIPIVGWNIAFIRMLFLGPTTLNVVCTLLYCVTAFILLYLANRMKCMGEYYEDAMKFADDYQTLRNRSKKGEMVIGVAGKTKKFGKANVRYKGYYAKAIFYRQLLEYKKEKFFIFGFTTLFCALAGGIIAYFCMNNNMSMELNGVPKSLTESAKYFIVPGVSAYMTFLISAANSKWGKELENAYTFLIPDSPVRKLWYATLIMHIRSVVEGALLSIPVGIVLELSPVVIVLTILIYVCLQANKLYIQILGDALLGNVLGVVGRQIFRMVIQGIIISIAVVVGVAGSFIMSVEVGFLAIIIYTILITGLIAFAGSFSFAKMEMPG